MHLGIDARYINFRRNMGNFPHNLVIELATLRVKFGVEKMNWAP
jgi:hypothetical protein